MTLLIMALIGNVIHDAFAGNPSIINYVMFVSVFAMLSLFYLIGAAIMEGFAIPIAMVALDAINMLLFLVGGIALAAYLGVHSCGRAVCLTWQQVKGMVESLLTQSQSYVDNNKITNGSHNRTKRCHEEQAVCAFLWFGFAAWAGSLALSALSSRGGSSGLRRGKHQKYRFILGFSGARWYVSNIDSFRTWESLSNTCFVAKNILLRIAKLAPLAHLLAVIQCSIYHTRSQDWRGGQTQAFSTADGTSW